MCVCVSATCRLVFFLLLCDFNPRIKLRLLNLLAGTPKFSHWYLFYLSQQAAV